LKAQLPFSAGGKQLTDTEKELVFRGLNMTGKSDDSILRGLNQAMAILREKENLALHGLQAPQLSASPIPGLNQRTKDVGGSKFQIGQEITLPDGRTAMVVGVDDPNDPDLEIV